MSNSKFDYSNDPYVKDMFWPSFHPGRSEGHWSRKNEKEWTPEEIEAFLKEELNGHDVIIPLGCRVLVKRPFAQEKIKGIILPQSTREDVKPLSFGKVLDWGMDAWRYKRIFPSGPLCNRGDWISFKTYEHTPIPMGMEETKDFDFDLVFVYDDKISIEYSKYFGIFDQKRL